MNKIKKLLTGLQLLITKPYLINKVIDDESIHHKKIQTKSKQYQDGLPLVDLTTVLPSFNETVSPYAFLGGGSLITDLALLKGLAKQYPNCFYFEIGTWRGESVANVATVTPNCYTLNLPDEALKQLGCSDEYINQQEFFSKAISSITHLKGNSRTFDFSPYYGKCDLVFVDGDHHYDSVLNDTQIAFKLLKDENSIIVWHDYHSHTENIRWDVFRGILDGTPATSINNLYHISNTLCAIYSKKPFAVHPFKKMLTPNKVFEVKIEAKNY